MSVILDRPRRMLHPEHYCSQRRVRGQSDWQSFLCKTLLFSISSRFIPALSLTPVTDPKDSGMAELAWVTSALFTIIQALPWSGASFS